MIEQLIEKLKAHKFDATIQVEIIRMYDAFMAYAGIVIERGYRKLQLRYCSPPAPDTHILVSGIAQECIQEIEADLQKCLGTGKYIYALHSVVERSGLDSNTCQYVFGYGVLYGRYYRENKEETKTKSHIE